MKLKNIFLYKFMILYFILLFLLYNEDVHIKAVTFSWLIRIDNVSGF